MDVSSDIRSIVEQYLRRVRKSGPENVMAICPFHMKADGTEEKHPSFAMSLTNGLWFCHACQASGNLFTFLRDLGLSRHTIEIHYRGTIEAAERNAPPKLDPLNVKLTSSAPIEEGLLGLFDYCPVSLLEDGFQEETLRHFGVGFDSQHTRITYPIRDLAGRLVGISGRSMQDTWPKYKIYEKEYVAFGLPERLNWDKSSCLWNANAIYPQLLFQPNPSYIVIVEGFKACMWLWQCGIKNVVALIGTYLSPQHQWILERLGAPIYLFLDNNYPGVKGVRKAGDRLIKSLLVHVVTYPERLADEDDAQPDSLTPEEVIVQCQNAVPYPTWITT